jgi:PilZ domain
MSAILIHASDRCDVRHAVTLPCSVVREKDFTVASQRMLDLSAGGMRVELHDVDVQRGDRFFVYFRTVGHWFFTDAFATRLLLGRRRGEAGPSLALRFGSLAGASRLRIRRELRHVPPHAPERAPRIDHAATMRRLLYNSTPGGGFVSGSGSPRE